jgi:hypothetical protein
MSFLKGLWQSILNFIGRNRNEETYRSPYVNESVSKKKVLELVLSLIKDDW